MAKKRKEPARSTVPSETRAAEALTVGWLLSVMTAGLCELGSGLALALRTVGPGLDFAARYLFFAALVIGVVSLILAAGVYRVRRVAPPRGVTVVGLAIGAAPLVVVLLMSF